MKRFIKPSILAAITAVLVWLPAQAQAQQGGGRGNFDPAEMRQRMMDRYKTTLEITNDDEWKAIEPRIQKINEARREVGFGGGGMRGMMGGFGGQRRGGDQADQGGQQRRRPGAPEASAATQELQKAIESKASADTIKAKLAAYRADRAAKQAALDKAQEDLKKVLTVRQEALAVVAGLLD
jgi:hypothetical protein